MAAAYLTEDHEIFRKSLRKFLEKEAYPYYEQWEKDRIIPREFWKKMGEQGYLCPDIEEQYGGSDVDWGFSVVINEEIEKVGSGTVGIGLHNDIVVPYITAYGTDEQKKRWLPKCTTGEIITAIAMTEPGAGSDLASISTIAKLEGDTYIVNGAKTFITNGIHSDLVIVACKTDPNAQPKHKGISLIAIERDTPGFSRGRKLEKVGLHCQDTAELIFEDCLVPKENLIGEEGMGFKYLMQKLQQERLVVAIAAQVAAEEMLRLTIDYVKERQAFGKSISRFQNTQFKMAEMATEVEMGRAFLNQLICDHMKQKDVVTQVSMAKWKLTENARRIATDCMQLHGGYGYMEEYEIARRYRDIPVASIYAGTNEIMKTIIAKKLGL
ncbi:acyl-CoA dehydrogenase [Cytobacillus horneckiae]|uniref:Acyl-[acyl-carrier-protein] dehydrogenase MbtN n=1 Tax=Cytobacillus horneckiae TaxID=549687 RepID=A0A2N0ZLN0_9BACI|nr:acyl-CoA dehydrogenase family protein [Cytobacillus horneckiae]MBN6885848.1 acyl-CoA dehydrogenase family protein [Cytobacillus horneckiae]MEC1156044.1 acyl-CoA dehydrogenase family protein [Cytobacillus horneckiae]MED2937404.1 acyl-CoA dehydrogenase family protein [Cytobacillus horneckiae]PKG30413.1 acyl-CoA dehydrogenase [Cytobacillus horneckiae]